MKKLPAVVFIFFLFFPLFSGEASKIAAESAACSDADDSISYVESKIKTVSSDTERRALYIFLGELNEQLSHYDSARECYAAAAGIASGDAEGMPKKSNEQLVLDAVRCALSLGDSSLADSYLNSAVRNSTDKDIQSYIKLYSQWSALCKAQNPSQINDAVIMLKAYTQMSSLEIIQPAVFLTLWYITGTDSYASLLKEKFPNSIETAVVSGKAQLLPSPFWYFVPRSGTAVPEIADEDVTIPSPVPETETSSDSGIASSVETEETDKKSEEKTAVSVESSNREKPLYLQLGLFRNKENADSLVSRLTEKGFKARIISEVRPSGTTYYIVAVDDNASGTTADELKTIGFESYPVF